MAAKEIDLNRLEIAAELVAAYVSRNSTPINALPGLIESVHEALDVLATGAQPEPELTPAVPIKRSIQRDHIVCLEDGEQFKSLKRHLGTTHGMTPAEYRAKWGLREDYPMVAPAYSEERSALAKTLGLGRRPGPRVRRPRVSGGLPG